MGLDCHRRLARAKKKRFVPCWMDDDDDDDALFFWCTSDQRRPKGNVGSLKACMYVLLGREVDER